MMAPSRRPTSLWTHSDETDTPSVEESTDSNAVIHDEAEAEQDDTDVELPPTERRARRLVKRITCDFLRHHDESHLAERVSERCAEASLRHYQGEVYRRARESLKNGNKL